MSRLTSLPALALISLLFVGGGFWYLRHAASPPAGSTTAEPLVVHVAAGLRVPTEKIAAKYRAETGQQVELRFGASQTLLANVELTRQGDLYVPADESYLEAAKGKDLLAERLPLARMKAVVLLHSRIAVAPASLGDLYKHTKSIAQANVDASAIGKLTKQHLARTEMWKPLERRTAGFKGTVNAVGNAVKIGSVDAGIVWDAVAFQYPDCRTVSLPELDGIRARVEVGVLKTSANPTAALEFARYIASEPGLSEFRDAGFADVENGDVADGRPEITLYAGAMLRPAIEATVVEFEIREGVRVNRVYNGCGILVGQMKAGEIPDVYFACDTRFMGQVEEHFPDRTVLSTNQLVIAFPKANPKRIRGLDDLGQPGLRLGVGHEQQCALGAITKETFIVKGVYGDIMRNVEVQSPSGDLLINKLRTGSLDAVVAYISNVRPYEDELASVAVTGVACTTPEQPIAVSNRSMQPQLAGRLIDALKTAESKARFEELGFGWGANAK